MILFREIYKEANDSVHGDRKIIDRAFEAAEKPEKRKSRVLKYSFIGTAAAAVLVAGAVFVNYSLVKLPVEEIPAGMTEQSEEDETASVSQEEQYDTVVTMEAAVPKTAQNEKQYFSANETESISDSGAQKNGEMKENTSGAAGGAEDEYSDEVLTESASEAKGTDTDMPRYVKSGKMTGSEEAFDDSRSGAEVAMMTETAADIVADAVTYTAEEYFEYIGIDFSKLSLPEGLKFDINESYTLSADKNGEILGDVASFTAFNAGRGISVMTSRTEDIRWEIDACEKVSENVSVLEDGVYTTLYAVKDGAYIAVFFENIPKEEMRDFTEQILK